MRTIALEEHFASPGFLDGPGHELKAQALKFGAAAAKLFEQLCDVFEKRIAEMDAAGIDVQVLSLASPGTEQLEGDDAMALARESNDFLANFSGRSSKAQKRCMFRSISTLPNPRNRWLRHRMVVLRDRH